MRVLVTGGTGVIGRPTLDMLLERGHTVRLLSRHARRDAGEWPEGVEPFQAQVSDAATLTGAVDGCDAIIHIAGIAHEHPPDITFQKVNVDGTRNLLTVAALAGAPRFIFISSLGADRGDSDYHRSKREAEALVRGYAGDWLILRPGNVYGPGDEVISLLLKMVRTLPAVPIIGGGDQAFQPIWAEDCAAAVVAAVEGDQKAEALDLAGPDITTMRDLLDRLERITGRNPVRIPVPEAVALTAAQLADLLGVDVRIHPDQLVMLTEENVIPPDLPNALTEVFGVRPTPLDTGLGLLADAIPERTPEMGTGPLQRHRYWAIIRGSSMDSGTLIRVLQREFKHLVDPMLIRVGPEPGSGDELREGETVTLALPMRGNVQVRVEQVKDREITAVTLEGHPLSGTVRFLAEDVEDGAVKFEVRSYTRPSTILDRVAMRVLGETLKGAAWVELVEAVADRSGGAIDGDVRQSVETLEGDDAREVEAWVDGVIRERKVREG